MMRHKQRRWFQDLTEVGSSEDQVDTRERTSSTGVDVYNASMRMGATQDGSMQHIREINVVNKVAFSTQQARIFCALNGSTKPACCHHSTSKVCLRRRSAASLTA